MRCTLAVGLLLSGCVSRDAVLHYPHDDPVQYYRDYAETINYPDVSSPTPSQVALSEEPHTIANAKRSEPWDLPLADAVAIALHNNRIIRSAGQFLSPGNTVLTAGDRTPSVYDPAIQETGVLFGTRGLEAALAAFDANFTAGMTWGRNEQIQNNVFFAGGLQPGNTLTRETAAFQSALIKQFGYGGQVQVGHDVNYLGTDNPGQLFPSVYTGNVNARYRQPLLAGAGTEFTRIAGPITQSFGGITGVTQGVVIARINNDISIADFEEAVRNLIRDVEDTYWDLYLVYRNYDTAVTARNAALATYRFAKIRVELGADIDVADESQARDQYWAAVAAVDTSLSNIFTGETRLRRLLGLPINEGRVIRPSDEPVTAEYVPDWEISLAEALTQRVELRKQKWNIKSLELQLTAAHSLTRPRLDFVADYQVNGFGDHLLGYDDADIAGTAQGLDNFYETLTQGNQTGWGLGFELSMPIGFRQALAQVRNIELRLAKAREVLAVQEIEIGHELAVSFQELARAYAAAQANFSRRAAAIDNVETTELQAGEIKTIDEVLRAQERRAQAEVAFFSSVVEYNKALTDLNLRKGTLLTDANVRLLEGGWCPDAYVDAYRRAQCRTGAVEVPYGLTEPPEFARQVPMGGVGFAHFSTDSEPPSEAAAPDTLQEATEPPPGDLEHPFPDDLPVQPQTAPPTSAAEPPLSNHTPHKSWWGDNLTQRPRIDRTGGFDPQHGPGPTIPAAAAVSGSRPVRHVERAAHSQPAGRPAPPSSFDDYFGSFGAAAAQQSATP